MACIKRPFDEIDGGRLPKFPRLGNHIRLETESELSDIDSESELSFQMQETASARDTSDTSSKSEDSEYTLASLSEASLSEVSSGPDDVCIVGNFDQLVSELGSDISVVADLSDFSDRSSDPEISKADYWKCVRCGTTNKNPCFRLCIRCFRERKSGLPPQPRPKNRKQSSQSSSGQAQENGMNLFESSSSQCKSSPESETLMGVETHDSGLGSSQPGSDLSDTLSEPKCGCCFQRPVDSIFLHGDVAHQIYCYKCSQKIWKERKRCPCCNRVSKVVKVYRGPLIGEH